MANIVKLQEDLKGIPLKNLIMYVQNPNGQVPSYLALAEIKRRKTMEQKAAAQQNAPATTSVAEDLTSQQRDQSGIANLPTGNMYDEKNYANGGIVAFADGGEADADAMNLNVQPTLNLNSGESNYILPSDMSANQFVASGGLRGLMAEAARRNQGDARALNWMFNLGSQTGNSMYDQFQKQARSRLAEGGEVKKFAGPEGSVVETDPRTFGEDFSLLQRYITNLPSYLVKPFMERAAKTSAREAYNTITKNYPSMPKDVFADKKAGIDIKAPTTIPGANVMGSQASADSLFKTPYDPSQSLGYKGAPYKEPAKGGEPGVYDLEKIKNIGDYAKELQDYLGPDKNVALQRERLAKMEDRASRMERDAPYLALTEAGFGMMSGTSPFALTNIGTGAQMGLKSYAAAQDKFAALEEKRLNLAMNIDQAERREKVAVAEFGAKSKQAAEERNFKRKLQREHDKVLMAMNTDDNIKALEAAAIKNQPNITETLKLNEYVESKLPQEKTLILEELGGNADKPSSKNYSTYLKRIEQAKVKLANEGRTIPGLPSVSGSPVTTKRAKFLGFE